MAMNRSIPIIIYTLLLTWCMPAKSDPHDGYTAEHPLTIVCDRDFPPFEFINDNGQPDGLNIDVLNRILDNLNIPHTFIMREWNQATNTFEKSKADLIFAPVGRFPDAKFIKSRNVFSHYKLKIAYRKGTKPITRVAELTENDTLVLKESDFGPVYLNTHPHANFHIVYLTPREALAALNNGKYKYFIWGGEPLRLKLKELSQSNIELGSIDIPGTEMFLVGHDQELIEDIDDQYTRLEQKGQLKGFYDKWLHPELVRDNTSPLWLILLAVALLVGIIGFALNRLILLRVKASVKKATDLNNIMEQALSMGDLYVLEMDLKTNRIVCSSQGDTCLCGDNHIDLIPKEGLTLKQFLERLHPDKRNETESIIRKLMAGEMDQSEIKMRLNAATPEDPVWLYLNGHATIEQENGQRRYLVISAKDVTREIHEERADSELSLRYQRIFDSNPIAMAFYDKDGILLDVNDKMRQLCNFDETSERFFRETKMFDTEMIKGEFAPGSREQFHCCQHMYYPEIKLDKYIEIRIRPIFETNGQLTNYIVTAREVTEERDIYLQQEKVNAELRKIGEDSHNYEEQLHNLLENCDMYVWQFDIKTRMINVSRSLRHVDFSMSRQQYMEGMVESEREEADRTLMEMITKGSPFIAIHHFNFTPANPEPCWYSLNGLPTFNANGQMTGYFGICRNITKLMDAQEKLRQETMRAEMSGRMKSAFLANMTHEIRTPLNAIVGFSDLLQLVDSPAERQEFIRIIRNNCDMLIRLIDDILVASNMRQALAIEPKDIDFATVFNDICQSLAQRVQQPGVEFISDNPYISFPARLDKGRVQQVITNFVTNAIKYTKEGHIRVGYREENGGIYIYCEDTGTGIPKEKQAAVFERFVKLNDNVQGTGLGLSICRSIAERFGGRIGVNSEGEGHGSTFWMWIPRKINQEEES